MRRAVAEVTDADADSMVLVMDPRNTHTLAGLSHVSPPEDARRLYARVEGHHTPQHARWLHLAATERSVLGRQGLDRRLASQDLRRREVAAWEATRHRAPVRVDWPCTTADARLKLTRLDPMLEPINRGGLVH